MSDADARVLYDRLLPGRRGATGRADPGRAAPGTGVAGGVRPAARPRPRARRPGPAHRVWFPADYDAEFDALFRRPVPVPDPTVYVHAPDDPAMAPPDGEAWFVLVNAPVHDPAGGVDWDAPGLAEQYADRVLEVLARRGEDVRGRVRWREIRTPADLERDTGAPGGAIYGTASHGPLAALLRPANRSPVPGLFLVGGSAHPGGGLPIVALSAKIVADLVGPA